MRTGFAREVASRLGYYVYLLIDPRGQEILYVGRGFGDRCFDHLRAARARGRSPASEFSKLDRIRQIKAAGGAVRIDILRDDLTEQAAFDVEAAAIDLLRLDPVDTGVLTNVVAGHGTDVGRATVDDVNALYGAVPIEIASEHRVVLIRINKLWHRRMTAEALYEATRTSWVIGPTPRRDPRASTAPQFAFAVFDGVVRAVYEIAAWHPSPAEPGRPPRFAFTGRRDAAMESRYVGRDVSAYLRNPNTGHPMQDPMRFVNCA